MSHQQIDHLGARYHPHSPFIPDDSIPLPRPIQIYIAQIAIALVQADQEFTYDEIHAIISTLRLRGLSYKYQGDTSAGVILLLVPEYKTKRAEDILEEAPRDSFASIGESDDGTMLCEFSDTLPEMLAEVDEEECDLSDHIEIKFVSLKRYTISEIN